MMIKRKARSDRRHLIYSLSVNGKEYIGVTFVDKGRINYSLTRRWQKHVRRAMTEGKDWKLCTAIRKYGPDNFYVGVLEVVRGKSTAHVRERELIRERKPKLNTDIRWMSTVYIQGCDNLSQLFTNDSLLTIPKSVL